MAAAAASRGAKLALREIRIHLCQRSPNSQGVRDFVEKRYVELKKANSDLPILIRECSDVQPKLWARYDGYKIIQWGCGKAHLARVHTLEPLVKKSKSL